MNGIFTKQTKNRNVGKKEKFGLVSHDSVTSEWKHPKRLNVFRIQEKYLPRNTGLEILSTEMTNDSQHDIDGDTQICGGPLRLQ